MGLDSTDRQNSPSFSRVLALGCLKSLKPQELEPGPKSSSTSGQTAESSPARLGFEVSGSLGLWGRARGSVRYLLPLRFRTFWGGGRRRRAGRGLGQGQVCPPPFEQHCLHCACWWRRVLCSSCLCCKMSPALPPQVPTPGQPERVQLRGAPLCPGLTGCY